MKITKRQLTRIIKEELGTEREVWLPNDLGEHAGLVSQVGRELDWDVGMAMAFAVALLEDVNAHDMAKQVNSLLLRM